MERESIWEVWGVRGVLALVAIVIQSLFSGLFWGFTGFQAAVLNESLGISYDKLSVMIPTSTAFYLLTVFLLGTYESRIPHKILYLASAMFGIAHSLLVVTASPYLMIIGYMFGGISFAIIDMLPIVEIRILAMGRDVVYQRLYVLVSIAEATSFAGGRVLMMMSLLYGPPAPLSWQLPWMIEVIGLSVSIVLMLFGKFFAQTPSTKALVKQPAWQKIRSVYSNSAFLWYAAGYAWSAFAFGAITAWYPSITRVLFPDESEEYRNWVVLASVMVSMPLAILGTSAVMDVIKRIRYAVRLTPVTLACASVAAMLMIFSQSLLVYCVGLALFLALHYFPFFVMKTMPLSLGLRGEEATFAISQFSIIYSLFGDIVGVLVTGILGGRDLFYYVLIVVGVATIVATAVMAVPGVYSFLPFGFVYQQTRLEAKEEEARDRSDVSVQEVIDPNFKKRDRRVGTWAIGVREATRRETTSLSIFLFKPSVATAVRENLTH